MLTKRASPSLADSADLVSVIVPTYNEEEHIAECLDSLLRQTRRVEMVVVDDGSTDTTVAIVQRYSEVKLLHQLHGGPARARNLGVAHSTGRVLAFCDADMSFAPDYIERLVGPIERGEAIGTFSKEEYVANYENPWARCWNLHWGLKSNRRHPENFPDEQDIFRAIERSVFESVGGFSDTGYEDDATIGAKLGRRAKAAPGAVCYHYNPGSLPDIVASARWVGRGQGVPKTWSSAIRHTLPWSLIAIAKRTWRYRSAHLLVFKIVYDFGVLLGILSSIRHPGAHWK